MVSGGAGAPQGPKTLKFSVQCFMGPAYECTIPWKPTGSVVDKPQPSYQGGTLVITYAVNPPST
jgi:hypothetical protein